MRKNRTKHEAKKPRLAKRALALCFALIFVCSCLLPVFAHGEENLLAGTQGAVAEHESVDNPTEGGTDPVLLNEGGTDSTGNDTNPTEGGEEPKPVEPEQKPAEPEQPKPAEQPKTEGATEESKGATEETKPEGTTGESKDTAGETKPEETKPEGTTGESKDSTEEQPKNEGTTEESKDTAGETKPEEPKTEETKPEGTTEEPKTEETKPEEPKQPTTNTTGDTVEQGKATYTYRFWPDKIDAFELEAINDAVKKGGETLNDAAQSRAGMVPCTVLTVMTNANLRDYQANVQQPTKDGYEFAGWYTVDGTTEDEFSFEQSLNFEKSQTIDVFAKWNELVTLQTTVTVDVDATLFGGEAAISLADEYSYEDDRMAAPTKTLTLDVKATNLSSNSELSVSSASSSAIEDYCDDNELVPILTLDITPKDISGNKTEPQGTSTVTISGLSELELPDELTMVHKKDDGNIETIPAQYSNGTLTFKATSFSTYAVAAAGAAMEAQNYTTQTVYVYVKVTGNTNGLYGHNSNGTVWYTLGSVQVSLPRASGTYVNHGGWNHSDLTQRMVNALPKMERNGRDGYIEERLGKLSSEIVQGNRGIDIKKVTWTGSGLGATTAYGAECYVSGADEVYRWHLDGKIDIQDIEGYSINYYEEGTTDKLQDSVQQDATVGTVINPTNNPDYFPGKIEKDGVTYELVRSDPENKSITVTKGRNNVINLYYRDISTSYPLFVYARISDTVYNKLHDLTLNASQWYTLGVVDKSGLSQPTGGVVDQDKKDHISEKYNTAVESLNRIDRYEKNQEIDLSWVQWNHPNVNNVSFGLTRANGADDYADTKKDSLSYTNGDGIKTTKDTLSYHLDGYIPSIGAVVINYYIKGTDTPLRDSVIHYGRTSSRYTLTSSEKPSELSKNGVTYTLDESSITPTGGTQAFVDDEVNTINLYYDRVVNPSNIPDSGESFIVVEKRFSGLTESTIPKDFAITVDGKQYGLNSRNVVYNRQVNDDYVVRWKITGVDAGEYRITESEYEKPGYKTEAKVTGGSTFIPATGTTVRVEVPTLNSFSATVITPKDNPSYDVKMEGTTNTIFVGRLTGKVGNGLIVFTKEPLSYAQREAIKNVLKTYQMENGGTWGKNNTEVHFYSVDEQLTGGNFNIDGSQVTHNNGKITFSDQGIWSMVATATYSTTEAQNPEVSITNTYTLNTTNVTITKKTTGAFADRAKAFEFTVSGLNADATLEGTNVTGNHFTLSNGQSVTIKNLEVGQTITITEDATDSKDYDTTADGHAKVNAGKAKSFQYEVCFDAANGEIYLKPVNGKAEKITAVGTDTNKKLGITVENNFDGNPDTGVLLDTLPYLILLAVAVAGGVLVVVRKRKHRDE